MDKLTALRHYTRAYLAHATQLATSRYAREWMEGMDFRAATQVELERHAEEAARWASAGFLAEEGLPLIASGMTVEMATATDPTTDAERMERLADRMRMMEADG